MDLIYTDEVGIDRGCLALAEGDFSEGSENSWALEVGDPCPVDQGGFVYVDGTEFGGVVDVVERETGSGYTTVSGRTWRGMLASSVVCPAGGEAHVALEGDANSALAELVERCGVGDVFAAPDAASGIGVSYTCPRFCTLLEAVEGMLRSSSATLRVGRSGGRTALSAQPAVDHSSAIDSDAARFTARRSRAYNHLVCLGSGELEERTVLHLYADAAGRVSETQSIFGAAHMAAVYDYGGATDAELRESGEKRLAEMQASDAVSLTTELDGEFSIGDVVGGYDAEHGVTVTEAVTEKIARVSGGCMTVEYKTGNPSAGSTPEAKGGGSSSQGGASYVAGAGIVIEGGTISAEVTGEDVSEIREAALDARGDASDAAASAGAAQASASSAEEAASASAASATAASASASDALARAKSAEGSAAAASSSAQAAASSAGSAADSASSAAASASTSAGHAESASASASDSSASAASAASSASAAAESAREASADAAEALGKAEAAVAAANEAKTASGTAGTDAASALGKAAEAVATADAAKAAADEALEKAKEAARIAQDATAGGFLAAHPAGSYWRTALPVDPGATYGGTWEPAPSMGAHTWLRKA